MAELAGVRLTDASGNPLLDDSASYIVDQNIAVVQDAQGVLHNANMSASGSLWDTFLDWLTDAQGFAEILALGPIIQNVSDRVDNVLRTLQAVTYTASGETVTAYADTDTYPAYSLAGLLSAINGITPAGLTTEEHDKLMGLAPGALTTAEHDHLMQLLNNTLDADQVASAVWGWNLAVNYLDGPAWDPMAQTALTVLLLHAQNAVGFDGLAVPGNPYWRVISPRAESTLLGADNWSAAAYDDLLPELDLTLVQDGDTVMEYLTREYATYLYTTVGPGRSTPGTTVYLYTVGAGIIARCTLTDDRLRSYWPVNVTTQTVEVTTQEVTVVEQTVDVDLPPVWPGLAGVTLGASYDLADGLTITTPMHGIIVHVATPPSGASIWPIGSHYSYYNWGQIGFESDGGQLEPLQFLGFGDAVYMPHQMKQAASVHIRVSRAATGTVRPFTINP